MRPLRRLLLLPNATEEHNLLSGEAEYMNGEVSALFKALKSEKVPTLVSAESKRDTRKNWTRLGHTCCCVSVWIMKGSRIRQNVGFLFKLCSIFFVVSSVCSSCFFFFFYEQMFSSARCHPCRRCLELSGAVPAEHGQNKLNLLHVTLRRTGGAEAGSSTTTRWSKVTCCGIFLPLAGCRARAVLPDCADKTAAWHTENTQSWLKVGWVSIRRLLSFITSVCATKSPSGVIVVMKCCLSLSLNLP